MSAVTAGWRSLKASRSKAVGDHRGGIWGSRGKESICMVRDPDHCHSLWEGSVIGPFRGHAPLGPAGFSMGSDWGQSGYRPGTVWEGGNRCSHR